MAPPLGHDGLLGHLMNFVPPSLSGSSAAAAEDDLYALTETTSFGPNPGQLRMLSYVPETLPPGAPLVVVLHGCKQSAAEYDRGTGWSTLADRFGFALLFPEQMRANNGQGCFNWFQPEDVTRGQGEVGSIAAMVTSMLDTHNLHRRRVYVTGLSAGGAMTAALLATYPDLFAGGAIIAGLPYGSASSVPEAFGVMGQGRIRPARDLGDRVRHASEYRGIWPTVSIWQGLADRTVNPVNAEELRKQWSDVHGVTTAIPEETMVDGAVHRVWRSPEGRPVVETYLLPDLAHATPIDPDADITDAQSGSAKASRYVTAAGIASPYRIAESWGLISHRRATRRPRAHREAPTPLWQEFLPGGATAMQDITAHLAAPNSLIGKVLRSAGLMPGRKGD